VPALALETDEDRRLAELATERRAMRLARREAGRSAPRPGGPARGSAR
jgi:hypothetical protein